MKEFIFTMNRLSGLKFVSTISVLIEKHTRGDFYSEENVPVVTPNQDPDLIALQNGIFNYKTKILEPSFRRILY